MCMDNRKQLRLPDNFAYILRTGGGNIRYSEFKISLRRGHRRGKAYSDDRPITAAW